MTVREEIKKKQQEYFSVATPKQKLIYLIQYYGVRTLLICFTLLFIGSWIYRLITDPKMILNGTFVNYNLYDTTIDEEELAKDFLTSQNIDLSKYVAEFQTNITIIQSEESSGQQTFQTLYTQIASGVLDFAVGDINILNNYAYGYHFVDLTSILSEEQIECFKPYFLYVDLDVLAERYETHEDIPFPDFRNPDAMKKPIPVMLDISNFPIIQEIYGDNSTNICYGIIKKGENLGNAVSFLEYLSMRDFRLSK